MEAVGALFILAYSIFVHIFQTGKVCWENTKLPGPSFCLSECCAFLGEGAAFCTFWSNVQWRYTFP